MFTKRAAAVAVSLSIMLSAASAGAAYQYYMTIKGTKQGTIKRDTATGSPSQPAENIPIVGFDTAIVSPRDPQSGLAAGKRIHKPFVITKEVDATSPKLSQAMTAKELFASFALVGPEAGVPDGTITVTLTNARISDITPIVPDAHHPELDKSRKYEAISVIFERMDVQHAPSGRTESLAY